MVVIRDGAYSRKLRLTNFDKSPEPPEIQRANDIKSARAMAAARELRVEDFIRFNI